MTEQIWNLIAFAFFVGLPCYAAYKIGHDNGYTECCDINRRITTVNREMYGDCPTCRMELNIISAKRVAKNDHE